MQQTKKHSTIHVAQLKPAVNLYYDIHSPKKSVSTETIK